MAAVTRDAGGADLGYALYGLLTGKERTGGRSNDETAPPTRR